jgi:hypothetical protein
MVRWSHSTILEAGSDDSVGSVIPGRWRHGDEFVTLVVKGHGRKID